MNRLDTILDGWTIAALDALPDTDWPDFDDQTKRRATVLQALDAWTRQYAPDPAADVLGEMEADYAALEENETAPVLPEPEPAKRTRGKGRTARGYRKKMDARERILRHLIKRPADAGLSVRDLAKALRVGHATVGDVRKQLREQQKTPAEMLAEIRSGR